MAPATLAMRTGLLVGTGFVLGLEATAVKKCSAWSSHGNEMECGEGVPLCGVLTLQTGQGTGVYHHKTPMAHGLWPEVGDFGTSKCIAPKDATPPSKVYPCYDDPDEPDPVSFEEHEWSKHGQCAGVQDAEDYFGQVCSLAAAPLEVLGGAVAAGQDLPDMADTMQRSGYCVFGLESDFQIKLSACAGADGRWKLADVKAFPSLCGSGPAPGPSPGPSPGPAPGPSPGRSCVTGQHGPPCTSDADCTSVKDCVRCAKSGFCTDVPLLQQQEGGELEFEALV